MTRFKRWRIVCLGLTLAPGLISSGMAAEPAMPSRLEIAVGGKSDYWIAVAEEADPARIMEAARLLQKTVKEASGAELAIVKESALPAGAPALYLGKTQAARKTGLPVDDIKGWSYHNRVVGKDVFLVGEDVPGLPNTHSIGYYGSLKAVTAFLEREVGVRYVLPGQWGTQVPQRERLSVHAAMDHVGTQRFAFLSGRSVSDLPYAVANNLFGKHQGVVGGDVHLYNSAVPAAIYFKTHPEYFALLNGKRDPCGERNHLCISNPEVQELLLKYMEKILDSGYEIVLLGQTDSYKECQCANCQAIHPDKGEKIWIVHRKLAEEMKTRCPGKKIALLSYVWTVPPPKSFDKFPDNVMIVLSRYSPEMFAIWKPWKLEKMVYLYSFLGIYPRVTPRSEIDKVRLFLTNGVHGIQLGGGLDQGNSPWGLFGPSYYAFGKAMADPERTADELEKEYVEAAFGEAAEPMQRFFETMHRRLEVNALIEGHHVGLPDRRYRGYPFGDLPGDFHCHFFPPNVLTEMRASLERALARATDAKVKARLALVEAEFRYLRDVAAVFHMYRAYCLAPSWETFGLLETQVQSYKATKSWLQPDGKMRNFPGLRPAFNGWRSSDKQKLGASDGPPFDWDFADAHTAGKLPKVKIKMQARAPLGAFVPEDE